LNNKKPFAVSKNSLPWPRGPGPLSETQGPDGQTGSTLPGQSLPLIKWHPGNIFLNLNSSKSTPVSLLFRLRATHSIPLSAGIILVVIYAPTMIFLFRVSSAVPVFFVFSQNIILTLNPVETRIFDLLFFEF